MVGLRLRGMGHRSIIRVSYSLGGSGASEGLSRGNAM